MRTRLIFLMLFAGLVFAVPLATAQPAQDCPAVARQALEQVANNCAIPQRSTTCYGFPGVTALDAIDIPISGFRQPSDRAGLLNLQEVRTSPLSLAEGEWGIAVTNIQANMPVGMPGQGGVLISMGDVRLENGVPASQALVLPQSPLSLTTTTSTELYSAPPGFGPVQEVVGAVAGGVTLSADGLSPDKQWARVFFTSQNALGIVPSAWVRLSAFPSGVDARGLPTIKPTSMTPMQKFYLTNGTEAPACAEALPSMLFVQGPDEIELDFLVNDAHLRVSSTALVRILPPGSIMQVIALSGIVILDPNGDEPVILAPGFFSVIPLTEPLDLGVDGRANDRSILPGARWSAPALLDREMLDALIRALENRLPQNLLYYGLTLPRLVCASGVGSPICVIELSGTQSRLRSLCQDRLLPEAICQSLGYP